MSLAIPATSQATLDTLTKIMGGGEDARNAINAAYALGAIDAVLRVSQPAELKKAA